jgi:hypothetical protein
MFQLGRPVIPSKLAGGLLDSSIAFDAHHFKV